MGHEEGLERTEIEAVLETRRELGSTYDAALVDSFADRIEAAVVARAAQEVSHRQHGDQAHGTAGIRQLALGIVTGVLGIPVTAIGLNAPDSDVAGLLATLIGWSGLVGINVAHALQSRRQGQP